MSTPSSPALRLTMHRVALGATRDALHLLVTTADGSPTAACTVLATPTPMTDAEALPVIQHALRPGWEAYARPFPTAGVDPVSGWLAIGVEIDRDGVRCAVSQCVPMGAPPATGTMGGAVPHVLAALAAVRVS